MAVTGLVISAVACGTEVQVIKRKPGREAGLVVWKKVIAYFLQDVVFRNSILFNSPFSAKLP